MRDPERLARASSALTPPTPVDKPFVFVINRGNMQVQRVFPAALFAAALFAQSDRGTITGTVSDAGGLMIAGVAITATHTDTSTQFKTTTNPSGEFNLVSLPVGAYRVVLKMDGFRTSIRDNVTLEAGGTARLDTKLEVGAVQQTIEVSAHSRQLQADDAKVINSTSDTLT